MTTDEDAMIQFLKGRLQKMKTRVILSIIIIVSVFGFSSAFASSASTEQFNDIPRQGMVTMLDLGATQCIPCKLMAPIIKNIETQYETKAAIFFIDVWQHPTQARRFGIKAIPTQIFFDENGKEVYRHVGFMGEKDIVRQLKEMGVN
jgi:thioredoxin 1